MCFMTTTLIHPLQPAGSSACLEFYTPSAKAMALDTIKNPKTPHKNFPFTTPTITTHKDSPTGALILEIIFSSDDVNSSGTNNTQSNEECNDEDDNSGESDDEDDADGNSDSNSNNSEDESDEGEDLEDEEDEEDGEQDEGDSEEDDEDFDAEHELDDEDFGNGFDKDLIIDFGDENEDDQLVVEFEDTSISSPPPSPPPQKATPVLPANPIPFWFTNEEPDQLRMIFESYGLTLNLEEQRKACVRSPAPFVGRIKRTPIKPLESETEKTFKTLDKVDIYLRELYPLGTMLPLSRVAWVLTTWDVQEGVPIHSYELLKSAKKSMQKRAQGALSSTLYCAPVFMTKEDYQYSVCDDDHSLMYASSSSTNASISRISPFLPEHCRTISFSMD